jgi:hypothetical protein
MSTKTKTRVKKTVSKVGIDSDRLYRIRQQVKVLNAEAGILTAQMKKRGVGEYQGEISTTIVYPTETKVLLPADVRALTTAKKFLDCVSVKVSAATEVIGKEKLEGVTSMVSGISIRTDRLKPDTEKKGA